MVSMWSDGAEALEAQQQPWKEEKEASLLASTPEWWVEALL